MANFCTKCGAPLRPELRFCPQCGAPVKSADPQPTQPPPAAPSAQQIPAYRQTAAQWRAEHGRPPQGAPQYPQQQQQQYRQQQYRQQFQQQYPQQQYQPQNAPVKQKGRRGLALLLAVVILAGLAVTGFKYPGFLLKDKTPAQTQSEKPEKPASLSTGKAKTSEKGSVSAEQNAVTLCGVTVDVDPMMLADGKQSVSVQVFDPGAEDDFTYESYELSLGKTEEPFAVPGK